MHDWPSKAQRRIYDVTIPMDSIGVYFYESNSWKVSKLYVQFKTSAAGLAEFMKGAGTTTATLKPGDVTINAKDAAKVHWPFPQGPRLVGHHPRPEGPAPTLDITVDETNPDRPYVFVVSTTTP